MNSDELLNLKKLLDEGVISQEEFDNQKEKLFCESKSKKSSKGLIIGIICVVLFCILIMSANFGDVSTSEPQSKQSVSKEEKIPDEFSAEFPIEVSGKMYDNIISMPEMSVSITNKTEKNISAIKFYFSPVDVYGEEVSGIFTTNELYCDDTISAGASVTKTWQMLDTSVKAGDVYIYSVYFDDGAEWGNKDAAISEIKKYAYKFNVKY